MFSKLSSSIFILCLLLERFSGVSADVVEYNFSIGYFIASPDGTPVNILGINNQIPSPTINVRQGDTLVVNVVNNDPIHSHSLHWHGISQKGSPEMDGVVGITQCGLPPSRSMTYRFNITDSPGTYWYHGHSGLTKNGARGIAGMLVIRPKEGSKDVHGDLYTEENELFLQDWSHESPNDHYMKALGGLHPPVAQSVNAHNVALYPWTSGLINGLTSPENNGGAMSVIQLNHPSASLLVHEDVSRTRLRIVNGGENFALKVSVDNHRLLIISTDGTDMEELEVDSVIVHLGERYDAILVPREEHDSLQPLQREGNYWIRARTLESDKGAQVPMNHEIRGILRYGGAPLTFPKTEPHSLEREVVLNCFDSSFVPGIGKNSHCLPITALRTHSSIKSHFVSLVELEPDETHEVAFEHSRGSKHFGHFTRVRRNVYDEALPSRASHREGAFTQFVLPSRPSYVDDGLDDDVNHEHTLHLDITHGSGVQIIWNHQGRTAHPIHIHGYKFVVAATHEADVFQRCSIVDCPDENDWFSWPAHKHVIDDTLRDGFVVKDTVVLPAGGYLVTRLIADNPGEWLAHCHTDFHFADGMGLVLREKSPLGELYQKIRPRGFPQCSGMEYEAFDLGAMSARQPSCRCLADPDTILHAAPEMEWRCSKEHLCRHEAVIDETIIEATDNIKEQMNSESVRGIRKEIDWKSLLLTATASIIGGVALLLFILRGKPSDQLSAGDSKTRSLIRLVYYDEWQKKMTIVGFVQVLGLSCVGGAIYFGSGFEVGERVFREKIAFVFWMCAFWSIGTIYSSIVTYYSDSWATYNGSMLYKKVTKGKKESKSRSNQESLNPSTEEDLEVLARGSDLPVLRRSSFVDLEVMKQRSFVDIGKNRLRVSILSYHIARWLIGLALSSPFAFLFAMITDSLTQMAPNVSVVFLSGFILLLTQQSFDALGRLLAEISGRESVGRAVCFGTIVSQALVIAGGFYRTVHPALSAIGPIRYSFSAISKLHFSSSDSFWCTPERALPWRGYTVCSLEQSGGVADLKFRGIDIINSYKTPSVWPDVLALLGIITFLRVACYAVAVFKAAREPKEQHKRYSPIITEKKSFFGKSDPDFAEVLKNIDSLELENSSQDSSRSELEGRTCQGPEQGLENADFSAKEEDHFQALG